MALKFTVESFLNLVRQSRLVDAERLEQLVADLPADADSQSMAAITPAPGLATYCASKAGLTRFAETVRMETDGTGINVTTMHLGPVDTEMWTRVTNNPAFDQAQRRLRQLRMLTDVSPDKVAADAVQAVIKHKREVRHPKRLWATMALAAAPGRITEFLVRGVDHRIHKN